MKQQKNKILVIASVALAVALITVCSWVSIPAFGPFVPFTLQTFAIFVIALLFGWKMSMLSILVYILLGAVGVPVFTGFKGGIGALLGPTGGYILGFIFMIAVIELFKMIKKDSLILTSAGMLTGTAVLYLFGTMWFYIAFSGTDNKYSILGVLGMCVFPFILPDIAKMAAALVIVNRLKKPLKLIGFNFDELDKSIGKSKSKEIPANGN